LTARGFTNVADIVNQLPEAGAGVTPIGGQASFGVGRNYIDLFGLGSNRTLTLVNGNRFVGDNPNSNLANTPGNQVNLNVLPTLLIDHVETIAATGAAVYGSDAISGVVNVLLKKKFEGFQITAQTGLSTYHDDRHNTVEMAIGHSFLNGRLNLAVDAQYDKTASLVAADRPWTRAQYSEFNPTNPPPAAVYLPDGRWSGSTPGGLPFQLDAQTPLSLPNGQLAQFANNGNLVPFNPGNLFGQPLIGSNAQGGDSLNYAPISPLQSPLERRVVTAMANYEITDHLHFGANLFYSHNTAIEPVNGPNFSFIVFGAATAYNNPTSQNGGDALLISSQNAFLNAQARSVLAANGVTDFYLSRSNTDISPNPITAPVTTVNSTFNLGGDFDALQRNFNWNVAFTTGYSQSEFHRNELVTGSQADNSVPDLFGYAVDSIVGAGGQPVCRITAQNPGSTDPYIKNCQPFNPFGVGNNSKAVLNYITADIANRARNEQRDTQFNIGTSLAHLPAGDAKATVGYERRYESATFSPSINSQLGVGFGLPQTYQKGSYATNEGYAEILLPILGRDFKLPFAERLQLEGAYRTVNNSIAGHNKSWSFGGEFSPIRDVTFRGSRSQTFRAPALTELFATQGSGLDQANFDPCQASNVHGGNNPAARQANCVRAFTDLGADLSIFTQSFIQYYTHPVVTGGNPNLKNEIGNSWTYGIILQPRVAEGLTVSADYVEINIKDAIEYFGIQQALVDCYDSPAYPSSACSLFQRQSGTGQVLSAQETYINDGFTRLTGVTYALRYDRNLNALFDSQRPLGRVGVNVQAFNTLHNIASVSGSFFDQTESAGTIFNSKWRVNSTLSYGIGPADFAWSTHYFSRVRWNQTYTAADIDPLFIGRSVTHDFAAQYEVSSHLKVHFNVKNVFNQGPPFPAGGYPYAYYDFVGRYFLLSVDAKL
jgi:outer membrane receptor protein involved in Fe transport